MTFPQSRRLTTVDGVAVRQGKGESAFFFTAAMTIDADGAPRAYHPARSGHPSGCPPGLDDLRNAGRPGNWFGILTDASGTPIVQSPHDPAPGFYVSATSLTNKGHGQIDDPVRYIDASTIPYVVLPPSAMHVGQARLGDFAAVFNRHNERTAHAIFADVGPKLHIGEGSIALAKALGIPHDPRTGGVSTRSIVYVVFPGSGNGSGRPLNVIDARGGDLLRAWGATARLRATRP